MLRRHMARPKRSWTKTIEESGITVRVFERSAGSVLYREVRLGGRKDRKSLGHRDRALAMSQGRELARHLAALRLTGGTTNLTVSHLIDLYLAHRAPLLSDARKEQSRRKYAPRFLRFLGDRFLIDDFGQTQVDGYIAARRSGSLKTARHRGVATTPRDGTIRNELNWLKSVFRWARGYKVNGRRLLASDPFEGLTLLQEKNPRRPVASEDRYQRTMAVAHAVDPSGRLACMVSIARFTGRRVNAIRQLQADDVFLTRAQIVRALAAAGMDEGDATHMPHGAIRFGEDHDKLGFFSLTAISAPARAAIDHYLREHPRVGSTPLFPDSRRETVPISRAAADHLLRVAERKAQLPKFDRGLWHPYRRAWASERKHQPDVDTARSGGWRDLTTMKTAYQQADAATMLKVIENATTGLTLDSPSSATTGVATS